MSEWKPIESVPKDGTVILGWRYYPVAIQWAPQDDSKYPWKMTPLGAICGPMQPNACSDGDPALTSWMPLPQPPEAP